MTPLDRAQFPVTGGWAYLNHAGVAPLPRAAVDSLEAYGDAVALEGGRAGDAHEERIEEVRAAGARLMGVPVRDVAFVKNTTEGLSFVASGLEWKTGDRVVVPACEFPSNLYPWLALEARGVEVVQVPTEGTGDRVSLAAVESALTEAPARLVAASWVQFGRGWRVEVPALAEIAHTRGALLCLDAIQGLGVLPADLEAWGVDFAAADAHKWMLGPEGIGLFYVRNEHRDRLRVLEPGWNSVAHRTEWENRTFVLDDSARRFEGGSMNVAGILALGASLDVLAEAGIDAVWSHVDTLCSHLVAGLQSLDVAVLTERRNGASGIVTFAADDPEAVTDALMDAGIVVSSRGGGVRVAPHGYNTGEEIDRLLEVLASSV